MENIDTNKEKQPLTFTAIIKSIRYYDPNSSWGALVVSTKNEIPHSKLQLDYDIETNNESSSYIVSIAGKMPEPSIGDIYNIVGIPEYVKKIRGYQYTIKSVELVQPKTRDEQELYLRSLVTNNQAQSILENYPNIVDDIISGKDNVDLDLIKGVGQTTWDKIKEKIVSNFALSDILTLLTPLGISFSKIKKLLDYETNPKILREKILRNPYIITEADGITFKTADKIANQLNPNLRNSETRLVSFIKYYLEQRSQDGDTWVTIYDLKKEVNNNIPETDELLENFMDGEKNNPKFLHIENDKISLKKFYDYEKYIYDAILSIHNSIPLEVSDDAINTGIKMAEKELGFSYTDEQKNVIEKITMNNFSSITGLSGTGKTSIARGVLSIYRNMGYKIGVCSLSAVAAMRIQSVTGFDAMTIHRLLGAQGKSGFIYGERNKLDFSIVLVDESSMINSFLFKKLFEAIDTTKTKVILMGDRGQLPPIGEGNVFSDLYEIDMPFTRFELTEIQRQAKNSGIILDSNKIRNGINPIEKKEPKIVHGNNKDLYYIFKNEREDLFNIAIKTYLKSVSDFGLDNVVLLVPRKSDTLNSTRNFNLAIQKEINFHNSSVKFVHGKNEFWLNDKVIHTKNDYDLNVFNGETGVITFVDGNGVKVYYNLSDKYIEYNHENINEIQLAYAISVHKSQGSEYRDVIIVLDNSHFMLLNSQLIYTAMTRSKQRCLILAEPYAFDKCLREDATIRNTWLKGFKN
jgi:exodeoxyribonuclease V alpha subunit